MMARAENQVEASIMTKMFSGLSEEEQDAVAEYLGELETSTLAQTQTNSFSQGAMTIMERAENEAEANVISKMMAGLTEEEQDQVAEYVVSLENAALAQMI